MKFFISEIFYSLQGEGIYHGVPSTFIRLSGCPMSCTWCDTPYASWKPEGRLYDIAEILKEIEKNPQTSHVVITGGEPYQFKKLPQLVSSVKDLGKTVTIETAGIIYLKTNADLISISPKTKNSDPVDQPERLRVHQKYRQQRDSMAQFVLHSSDIQWKFVTGDMGDLEEIEEILSQLSVPRNERVFLMPFTQNPQQYQEHSILVAQWAMDKGFTFCNRLHVQLWSDERGT